MAVEVSASKRTKTKPAAKHSDEDDIPMSTFSINKKTDIHEIMKQLALAENEQQSGKKKKKKADILLESLRRGDVIKKDEEDKLLQSNTYNPDNDTKSGKSNKLRDTKNRQLPSDEGYDNEAYEIDKSLSRKTTKKKLPVLDNSKSESVDDLKKPLGSNQKTADTISKDKRKQPPDGLQSSKNRLDKPKSPSRTADDNSRKVPNNHERVPSDVASPYESDEPLSDRPKARRKKKMTRQLPPSDEENNVKEEGEDSAIDRDAASANESAGEQDMSRKLKKKKKKKLEKVHEEAVQETQIHDDGRILAIRIHRTDKLRTDFFILHPVVRVHLVNYDTGQYVKKLNREGKYPQMFSKDAAGNRPATSFYETENVESLLPIITQPFDFKEERSMLPVWEEVLIYNENYNYFIDPNTKVILFFEVLDTVSMNRASRQNNKQKQAGGYYRIAWAFLKLVGANNELNVDRKLRLQLYQPPASFQSSGNQVEVFQWWKSLTRVAYPSTLYVTIKGVLPPPNLNHATRSMSALQQEQGLVGFDDLEKSYEAGSSLQRDNLGRKGRLPNWARLPGQRCRLPNVACLTLPGGQKGCFTVKFSPDGKMLACGCHDKDGFPVYIYDIPSGKLRSEMFGHYALIYEVAWSPNSQRIVTSSSDGTARLWDVEKSTSTAFKTLPHPAFVYSAQFHPSVHIVLVTSCFDRIIRVWSLESKEPHAELMQELDGHESLVNSVCFAPNGHQLFSADAVGTIRVWNVFVTDQPSKKGILSDWSLNKEIKDNELKGVSISHLQAHPNGNRLLVHTRDNIIRLFDLRMYTIVHRLMGALNFRERVYSTFTPCGSFVVSGSEDSCAYVWSADTGDQVAMYSNLGFKQTVCGVDFHTMDNYAVFCSFGPQRPILVYKYDSAIAQQEAGHGDAQSMVMTPRPVTNSALKTFSTIEVGEAKNSTSESSIGKVQQMHQELDKHKYSRLQRVTMTLQSASALINASHDQVMNGDLPLDGPATSSMLTGNWSPQASFRQRSEQQRAVEPSVMSPHARVSLKQIVQQQQLLTHNKAQRFSRENQWTPTFSEVGIRKGVFPAGGDIILDMSSGKPQVSVQGAKKKDNHTEQVVALYDYKAQRSDELNLQRGDVIIVLHKDNDTWWMGQLMTGQQGYFMANYVATYALDDEKKEKESEVSDSGRLSDADASLPRRSLTAVTTKTGELKFLSGAEDSEDEKPTDRSKKSQQLVSFVDENSSKGQKRSKVKKKVSESEA